MSARVDPLAAFLKATPLDYTVQKHLRRVYVTLLACILTAVAGAAVDVFTPLPLGLPAVFLLIPSLLYFHTLERHSVARLRALYLFAFLQGLSAGPLVALSIGVDPVLPLVALMACAVVFAGFSVAALFARRRSFLYVGAIAWAALWGTLVASVANRWLQNARMWSGVLRVGMLAMCAFVLFDTQTIVEKVMAGDSDHVEHAMQLLVNFAGLFRRILLIMTENRIQRDSDRRTRRSDAGAARAKHC